MRVRTKILTILLLMVVMGTACAGQEQSQDHESNGIQVSEQPQDDSSDLQKEVIEDEPVENQEPVTLRLYQSGNYFSEDEFEALLAGPVKEKYPHITIENVIHSGSLEKAFAAGETVDFHATWDGAMAQYIDSAIFSDVTPLAKKHNFELGKFDQGALDAIRKISKEGELFALPYGVNFNALFYNKDIFDNFGVAYPPDGMTWDEAIELGRDLTRYIDGVQYKGLDEEQIARPLFPLSPNLVDPHTDEVMADMEIYRRAFEVAGKIYDIPGNTYERGFTKEFLEDRNLAMITTVNIFGHLRNAEGFNWDMAQFPSYPDLPNVAGMYDLHVLIPIQTSEHPDAQMQVMEVLFSDEVQTYMVRSTGKVSTLKDPKYQQIYAADMEIAQGKNIEAIFKSSPAEANGYSKYYSAAIGMLRDSYEEFIRGEKDVNTAVREAKEKIEQHIIQDKGSN